MSINLNGFTISAEIEGALLYKGTWDASTGTPDLSNAQKGDLYIIETGGTIYGKTWEVTDLLIVNDDMNGTVSNSKLDKVDGSEAGTTPASETVAGIIEIATNAEATAGTANNRALVPSNISSIGTSQLNNDANFTAVGSIISNFVNDAGYIIAESDTLSSVVARGATTSSSISTGGLTTSGDIDPDTNNSYSIGDEDFRFISYYGDMNGAIRFKAKNDQGGPLVKGEVVYIKGISGDVPTVAKAQANSASTMPAFGLVYANANDQAEVQIITFGNLNDMNTGTLGAGDTAYVSASSAGALVNTPPTGESNFIQNIGRVVRADSSAGIIKVGGAGRSNATPNLDQDKIFLGDASNQAVSTALSSVGLSKFSNDAGFLANINSENLNDLSDVSYTAGAGIDNYVLTYDHSTTSWGAESVPSGTPASETTAGIIEIATNAEATAGTATDKALVPSNLSSVGTSQLNNDAGFLTNINNENLNDLSDVSYTAGAGIDNYVLTYDHSTTSWNAEAVPSGTPASETTAGIIEIATNAEATAGTATDKALVPSNLSSVGTSQLNNDAGFITAESDTLATVVSRGATTTSPIQVGDLKLNSNSAGTSTSGSITTTSNNDIILDPHGSGVVELEGNSTRGSGQLTFNCEQNSHGITIKGAPHSALATYTMILPDALGTTGQYLKLANQSTGELAFDSVTTTDTLDDITTNGNTTTNTLNTGHLLPASAGTYNLGSADAEWEKLYLHDSGAIYFGTDEEVYLQHDHNNGVTLRMGTQGAGDPRFQLWSTDSSTIGPQMTVRWDTTSPADNDIAFQLQAYSTGYVTWGRLQYLIRDAVNELGEIKLETSIGTGGIGTGLSIFAKNTTDTVPTVRISDAFQFPITDGTVAGQVLVTDASGQLSWSDITTTDTLDDVTSRGATTTNALTTGNLLPSGTNTLGSNSAEWSNLYLGESSNIYFGADQDVVMTHNPNTGLTVKMSAVEEGNDEPRFILQNEGTTFGSKFVQVFNETSPATNDVIGYLIGSARNSNNVLLDFTQIESLMIDNTHGQLQSGLVFRVRRGNTGALDEGLKVFSDSTTDTAPKVRISDAFNLPTSAGSANQVLQSDGQGEVTWETLSASPLTYDGTEGTSSFSAVEGTHYSVDTSGASADITATLPTASSSNAGKEVRFKLMDATHGLVIAVQTNQILEGTTNGTYTVDVALQSITCVSNGSNGWEII